MHPSAPVARYREAVTKGSYAKEEVNWLKKEHKLRLEETKRRVQREEYEPYKRTASRRTSDRDTWVVSRKLPLNAHSEIVREQN
jgi:hypothetical protein